MTIKKVPHSTPLSSRINRDALMMVPHGDAARVAFEVLDALHPSNPSAAMLAGIAVAFAAAAQRASMAPDELHALACKVLRHEQPYGKSMGDHQLDAFKDYMGLRMRSDEQYI